MRHRLFKTARFSAVYGSGLNLDEYIKKAEHNLPHIAFFGTSCLPE